MEFDQNLRTNILHAIDALLSTRECQIAWLDKFISDVGAKEIIINSAKTGAAAISVASSVALFTPLAVLGIAGFAVSGVAMIGTTVGSFIANRVNDKDLKKNLDQSGVEETKLQNLLDQLDQLCDRVRSKLDVSVEMAQRLILYNHEIQQWTIGNDNLALPLMLGGGEAVVGLAVAVPKIKQMADVMEFSYGFANAARVASGTNVAIVLEETGQSVQAFYQITGSLVGTVSKCLGVAGAVVGVGDVIYSWTKDNPCVTSAKQCLEKVEQSRSDLLMMKKSFEINFEPS